MCVLPDEAREEECDSLVPDQLWSDDLPKGYLRIRYY